MDFRAKLLHEGGSHPFVIETGEAPYRRRAVDIPDSLNSKKGVPFTVLVRKAAHECACWGGFFLSDKGRVFFPQSWLA